MPLDPFFVDRLRTHRRYMLDQAIGGLRNHVAGLWPFGKSPEPPTEARAAVKKAEHDAEGPRATARARYRASALAWDRKELKSVGTRGPGIPVTEHEVTVDGLPAVRVRVYHPSESSDRAVPGCLALFGGAFRIGGIDYPTTDAAFRRRAADSGVALVAVDYALAPEHRFPTQVEQAHAALVWLFDNARDLGINRDRIGIAGISAGGNLAAAVTLMNRDRGQLPLRLQVLEVPVTDLTGRHIDLAATRALGIPSFLAKRELRSVVQTYLAHARDARNPYASPLLAASHADLPPAVVLTAEYDPLRSDGAAYAAALREAGVDASVVRYLGVTHDTAIFTGALPAARRWHDDVISALRRLHH